MTRCIGFRFTDIRATSAVKLGGFFEHFISLRTKFGDPHANFYISDIDKTFHQNLRKISIN